MKYLVLLLAMCSEMAWSQLQSGTVIFLDFEKDEITMSADSKAKSSNGQVIKDCKIIAFGSQFALETAGLLKDDFGILTWSTSAVCFGPPWAQQTSTLDLSVSLDSEAGVGLESQGGTIRADSVGV